MLLLPTVRSSLVHCGCIAAACIYVLFVSPYGSPHSGRPLQRLIRIATCISHVCVQICSSALSGVTSNWVLTNLRQLYLQYLADQKASDDPISEVSNIVPVSSRADGEHAIPPVFPLMPTPSLYVYNPHISPVTTPRWRPLSVMARYAALHRSSLRSGGIPARMEARSSLSGSVRVTAQY